jgi:two-component system chemotaxis response regulator CheY
MPIPEEISRKIAILIVDDFSTMRRIVKNTLKQLQFDNITEADDGTTALKLIRDKHFDLIISDWNMPNMKGIDLLKTIRADDRFKKTPFVMVTAESNKEAVVEAAKAGVSNYVVKPFTTEVLEKKLGDVFHNQLRQAGKTA